MRIFLCNISLFAETHSGLIGLISIVVTILAFGVTIAQVLKTKNAALAAKEAANKTKEDIQKLDSIVGLHNLDELISFIKMGVSSSMDPKLLALHCERSRMIIHKIRNCKGLQDETNQIEIQKIITQLRDIENKLTYTQRTKNIQNFKTLNNIKDSINDLITLIKKDQ